VLESGDVARALLDYAVGNQVSVIVMGAATHGLKTQRFVATVPIKVAMDAPCTVILVKQSLPFEQLGARIEDETPAAESPGGLPDPAKLLYGDDLGPLG
jgi:K+-sensing histidine kinase KdpD